jgi:hypothetical protein
MLRRFASVFFLFNASLTFDVQQNQLLKSSGGNSFLDLFEPLF